jgi:hypothetical protein
MTFDEFSAHVLNEIPKGTVLNNPRRGTTTILDYRDGLILYRRGHSSFRVELRVLYDAVVHFRGKRVASPDLQLYAPSVFDSRRPHFGHSCNCTVLFLLLQQIRVIDEISGRGVRGDPFSITVPHDLPARNGRDS